MALTRKIRRKLRLVRLAVRRAVDPSVRKKIPDFEARTLAVLYYFCRGAEKQC